ncbi:MAG: ABC-type phosphate/phosphonate transport system substrate-binding protein [Candidatus Latescibacterota bacterium]|jgi:ABC-type phosphate/phosphonate transport system substrate-binding protein
MPYTITTLTSLLFLLLSQTATAIEPSQLRMPSLVLGYSLNTLVDVDPADAKAASQIWLISLLKSLNKEQTGALAQVTIYQTDKEMLNALQSSKVDILLLTALEYLALKSRVPITPFMLTQNYASGQYAYGLYVHKDSGLDHLHQLKHKTLTIQTRNQTDLDLPQLWLDTLLLENGLEVYSILFKSTQIFSKTSQAVLPVFFQKADACLVPIPEFEVLSQFNPQIKRDLKCIAQSPAYIRSLICARTAFFDQFQDLIQPAILDLNNTTHGRQLRLLFKSNNDLAPFEAHQLGSVESLIEKHRALTSGQKK